MFDIYGFQSENNFWKKLYTYTNCNFKPFCYKFCYKCVTEKRTYVNKLNSLSSNGFVVNTS